MKESEQEPMKSTFKKQKNAAKIHKNSSQISEIHKNTSKNSSKIDKESKIQTNSSQIQHDKKKIQKENDKIQKKIQQDESKAQKMSQKFLARQKKIKAIALKMFISQGYEQTSLKDIIKKSGGSFSDIYATFENKQGLFVSVLEDILEERREEYAQIFAQNLPLRDTLLAYSLYMTNVFLQKKMVALVKIIYSQLYNQENHILIEHFKTNKEKAPEQALIDYFKGCPPPLCDRAEKYGETFFALLKGKCLEEAFFYERTLSKKEQEEHAEFIVDFFIKAVSK